MRERMNRAGAGRRAGAALRTPVSRHRAPLAAVLAVLLASGALPAPAASAASAPSAPPAPLHVPWTVRHELNRAEALLHADVARLKVGSEVQVLRGPEQVVLRVPAHLLFLPDSESLRPSLHAAELLSVPRRVLQRRHRLMTRIEVYTDNIGGQQLNQELSMRRAAALAGVLLSAGISPRRVQAYGRGSLQALAGNDTAAGRTLNRRVEFVFARLGSQAALAPPEDEASTGLRPAPAAAPAGG